MSRRIIIFASGNGTNFENIVKKSKEYEYDVILLFCNRKDANVINIAKELDVPYIYLSGNIGKHEYNLKILQLLNDHKPDLIILAGYMKIISKLILDKWENKVINIHPTYLPDFPGINAVQKNIESNINQYGVTIHYVDAKIDTGEIIFQKSFEYYGNNKNIIYRKIKEIEHEFYPKIINDLLNISKY